MSLAQSLRFGDLDSVYTVPDDALVEAADALSDAGTEITTNVTVEQLEELTAAEPSADVSTEKPQVMVEEAVDTSNVEEEKGL